MREGTAAVARGSTARATMEFLRSEFGAGLLDTVLARLDPEVRDDLLAAGRTAELPYRTVFALWESADAALRAEHPDWMERAGAYSIGSLGQELYGGLLHKGSPAAFVTQSVSLFRLYYSPGDIVAVEAEAGRAVVRLVGFDSLGRLFCERQTGGLIRATELAGGSSVRVAHVRCEHEGDAFCEWELRWD